MEVSPVDSTMDVHRDSVDQSSHMDGDMGYRVDKVTTLSVTYPSSSIKISLYFLFLCRKGFHKTKSIFLGDRLG